MREYLGWDDKHWILIAFVFDVGGRVTADQLAASASSPDRVEPYVLYGPTEVADKPSGIIELDFYFSTFPAPLDQTIQTISSEILALGGQFLWFGFEGTFHYENLLVARDVYAVSTRGGLAIASTEERRRSAKWESTLAGASVEIYALLEGAMPGLSAAGYGTTAPPSVGPGARSSG